MAKRTRVHVLSSNANKRPRDDESETRPDERTEREDFVALIKANTRSSNGYWSWRDKPIGERGAARDILQQAGVDVANLVSRQRGADPPDCEATLDGHFSGVEVTELVHQKALKRSIKAKKERQAGREPERSEVYFNWGRDDFLAALRTLIDLKDQPAKQKGGPYNRYVLVIHTDEFVLNRETVGRFLEGSVFHTKLITDVFLGLSYHPSVEPNGGYCPVFRLNLTTRRGGLGDS